MKTCNRCGKTKPLTDFAKNGKYRKNQCKSCRAEYRKKRHESMFTGTCVDCGATIHSSSSRCLSCHNKSQAFVPGGIKVSHRATMNRYHEKLNLLNASVSQRTLAAWSRQVRKRDGFICTNCGAIEKLHAHHILPKIEFPDRALDIDNGITLCECCHIKAHYGETNA